MTITSITPRTPTRPRRSPPEPKAPAIEVRDDAPPAPTLAPQRIARNFAALSVAEVACRAISIAVTLSLAQRLGREGYGRVEFAFNVVLWLVLLVRDGLDVIGTREIARHPRLVRPLVNHIVALRVCISSVLLGLLVLVGYATTSAPMDRTLLTLYGLMLMTTAIGVDFVFRGLERMGLLAVSLIIRTAIYAVGAAVWVAGPAQVYAVPIFLIIGELCGIALVWVAYIRNFGWPRPTLGGTRALRTIMRKGRPVYAIQISQAVIGSADLLVVGVMSQWADVGLYGAPHRMITALLTFGLIFRQTVFPSLARSWRVSPEDGRVVLDTMVRILMLGLIPIAVGATVLSGPIVGFLLTPEYADSGPLLALGVWRIPILTVAFLYQTTLIALNREQAGVRMLVVAAICSGPLAALLRWWAGLEGAALAMVIVGLGLLWAGHRSLALEKRAPVWHQHVGRPLLASAMMVPVCLLLSQLSVVLAIAGGASVYIGMIIVLNGLEPNDLRVLLRR